MLRRWREERPPPWPCPCVFWARLAWGPAVGRTGAAATPRAGPPRGSSAIGCRRAAPSTAGSASASARARRPPQFTPRGQSSPASRPALAPRASAYLQVQVALVEPAAVLILQHRQDEDLVLLQHPRHAVLRARARGGVRRAPRRGPRRLPRPRPPQPCRRVPRRRPGSVRPRPLHAARGAARAGPRPRPRPRRRPIWSWRRLGGVLSGEGEQRGRVRRASGGGGAEFTASGVPQEAFQPGDLAFHEISTPTRAPRPLFSPPGNTPLSCHRQRLQQNQRLPG